MEPRKAKKYWVLDVGVKLTPDVIMKEDPSSRFGHMDDWVRVNNLVEEAAGKPSASAGTGLGVRDMQFYYYTPEEAEKAKEYVEDLKLPLDYISIYTECPEMFTYIDEYIASHEIPNASFYVHHDDFTMVLTINGVASRLFYLDEKSFIQSKAIEQ